MLARSFVSSAKHTKIMARQSTTSPNEGTVSKAKRQKLMEAEDVPALIVEQELDRTITRMWRLGKREGTSWKCGALGSVINILKGAF